MKEGASGKVENWTSFYPSLGRSTGPPHASILGKASAASQIQHVVSESPHFKHVYRYFGRF